mgnify:CR=1 FL=1
MEIETVSSIDCIVCSKTLENWKYTHNEKVTEVHPMGGLHFLTYGHYGSTIFDPMGVAEQLDVAICDECIMKNLDKVRGSGKQGLVEHRDEWAERNHE